MSPKVSHLKLRKEFVAQLKGKDKAAMAQRRRQLELKRELMRPSRWSEEDTRDYRMGYPVSVRDTRSVSGIPGQCQGYAVSVRDTRSVSGIPGQYQGYAVSIRHTR